MITVYHDKCNGHNNDGNYDDNDKSGDVFVYDIPRVEIRRAETHHVDGNGHGTALGRTRINNEADHGIQNHLRKRSIRHILFLSQVL